jgi:hypothetical protein
MESFARSYRLRTAVLKRSALFLAKLEVEYEDMGMDDRTTTKKVRWQNHECPAEITSSRAVASIKR